MSALLADGAITGTPLTPVQELHGGGWVKRDDLFVYAGQRGGKVRTCLALAQQRPDVPLVTATTLDAPQAAIVAAVGAAMGRAVHLHLVEAKKPSTAYDSATQLGATVHRHHPGYPAVLAARAREHAAALGGVLVPWNMECAEAVSLTGAQVANLPDEAERLVVAVGSGMTLAGILCGLAQRQWQLPILGVIVGGNPIRTLDRWAPPDWRDHVTLAVAELPYSKHSTTTRLHARGGAAFDLDPQYEAKTLPHLRAGDILWVTGHRDPLPHAGA